MKARWYVVKQHCSTQKVVEVRGFAYKKDAEQAARDFNRSSQDFTWNAVEAYVISAQEYERCEREKGNFAGRR